MRTHLSEPPCAPSEQVDKIVGLSRAAEVCAVNADWREVSRIQARRRVVIDAYFSAPGERPRPKDADALREVLAIDRRVVELACERRRSLSDRAGQVGRGRAAVVAYRSESHR